ncbi:hypothetical protein ACFSUK_08100 [Sphingobium scionense]|uniref:Uncharacterized protein n=1 Tax=Sphingobium scionense TaxID=1404341 RepID=A0A7W6LRE3_9SPHN|nr:hypothetical protein [Sphingobium scionense]MBB4149120.1 hypothetical protein [Sphingobium scionense]
MNASSIIAGLIALLLPTKSVDGIVSVLTKVADRLALAEAAQNAKADDLSNRALQLRLEAEKASASAAEAVSEAERAARVRTNVTNLIA